MTVTDDWRAERVEAGADWLDERDLRRRSPLSIAKAVIEAADNAVPVVPLERAERAEAAARDLAQALVTVQSAKTLRGVGAWATPVVKQAGSDALARHPEYAPEGKESE